ncbi:MAG: nucleoside kinase, partial [Dictyoglomus sp.]
MINVEFRGAIRTELENSLSVLDILRKNPDITEKLLNKGEIPVAVRVDGEIESLNYLVEDDVRIDLIGNRSNIGRRILERSFIFLLNFAVSLLMPDQKILVEHSYHKSLYGRFKNYIPKNEDVEKIKDKMREISEKDLPIGKKLVTKGEA